MKKNSSAPSYTEDDIRDYAYHLYEQNGCASGRDLDNWLEAKACLSANIPRHQTHTRLHDHLTNGSQKRSAEKRAPAPLGSVG
jgi:hypothetical protein